jgi:hypothetical protein
MMLRLYLADAGYGPVSRFLRFCNGISSSNKYGELLSVPSSDRSQLNSIGIATGYGLNGWSSIPDKNKRRMASSGMLRRVALIRADVSEELRASFFRNFSS